MDKFWSNPVLRMTFSRVLVSDSIQLNVACCHFMSYVAVSRPCYLHFVSELTLRGSILILY